jgi:hypothetical protein
VGEMVFVPAQPTLEINAEKDIVIGKILLNNTITNKIVKFTLINIGQSSSFRLVVYLYLIQNILLFLLTKIYFIVSVFVLLSLEDALKR